MPFDNDLKSGIGAATESAAVAAAAYTGLGDERMADQVAVDAMRDALNRLPVRGKVVIGEGERDDAPMLYIGEAVGSGIGPEIDVALDPLEGTTICAKGGANAIAVLAVSETNGLLHAPDTYMDKIAVGAGLPPGVVDLDVDPGENIRQLADAKCKAPEDVIAVILDRPRHKPLVDAVRATGARVRLISDGDILGVLATVRAETGADIYMGTGGAPEGVLAAAAMRCAGGQFQGRLNFRNEDEKERARRMGLEDIFRKFERDDLVRTDTLFCATGVTDGWLLNGVRFRDSVVRTETIILDSRSGAFHKIITEQDQSRYLTGVRA